MKVQFTRKYYQEGGRPDYLLTLFRKGDLEECELVSMPPCCDTMKKAIDENYIGFGEFIDSVLNKDESINITVCNAYPDGAYWDYMPIQKCPFCGEDIEVNSVD
jgi:hypothetical protein